MKTKTFPYEEFERVPAWAILEQAIASLVRNKDLVEQTDRRYIVGFLIKKLNENGILTPKDPPNKSPKRKRIR
jgi:hypothetical protein